MQCYFEWESRKSYTTEKNHTTQKSLLTSMRSPQSNSVYEICELFYELRSMPHHKRIGKRIFVTGAAGFIGSNLVDRLLETQPEGQTTTQSSERYEVRGFDNFSTGQESFLAKANQNSRFHLTRGDCLDLAALTEAMKGSDCVFHLSANADVRLGTTHPSKDLQQNTVVTFNVLEAMRANQIKKIAFSSTGSIYGEAPVVPTPETAPFPIQTSLYGASKLAGEGLIQAYCEGFGFEGYIFRFVSILGERYTHGHVFDFYKQLIEHPQHLKVLGNGQQKKSYLYVGDCIRAMMHTIENGLALKSPHQVQVFNLGAPDYCQVTDSIGWISEALGIRPELEFTGGNRGWIGDNPFIFLDTQKIQSTGWKAELSIREGIVRTLQWLKENQWVFKAY